MDKEMKKILDNIEKGQYWRPQFDWISKIMPKNHIMLVGNKEGKVTFFDIDNKRFIVDMWFDDAHNFGLFSHKDCAIVKLNGVYNVVDEKGTFVFEKWLDYIDYNLSFNEEEQELLFVVDGKKEFVTDKKGNVIRELQFN